MTADDDGFEYQGRELELFADARNWRAYWQSRLRPYLGDEVLEVGAGIGSITSDLAPTVGGWTTLEPDRRLAARIPDIRTRAGRIRTLVGTIADLEPEQRFDSVLYVDVLEHIEEDVDEVRCAAAHLRPGGRLIVLVPAFPFLYSAFDASVGHHRRYTRGRLRAIVPSGLRELRIEHLDTLGFLSAVMNRLVLRQDVPVPAQVRLWDRTLVPISRLIDPLIGRRLGKSIVGVWELPVDAPGPSAPGG